MDITRASLLSTIVTLAALPGTLAAQEGTDVGSQLPPNVRNLLVREMLAVLEASQQILDALVRGHDERVAAHAQATHDSFIMQREMTEADRRDLRESVPPAFLQRDQAFHQLSAELADAARRGNQARQRGLFQQLLNACVDCHAAHATKRFPDLVAELPAAP